MAQKLYNRDDVIGKLQNTICLYKGVPCKVTITDGELLRQDKVTIHPLNGSPSQNITYTSDDFNYSCVELGWFKHRERVSFLCRMPGRYNNLGLARNNLDEAISSEAFFSKEMHDCVLGIHPTFHDALKQIWTDAQGTIPFHRNAALIREDNNNAVVTFINKRIALVSRDGSIQPYQSSNPKLFHKLLTRIGVH
jgi:hypothetical protein